MQSASIFEKALPAPYRIFGLELLPLSLGRYRLLKRFGCAFVDEGEARASIEDLLLGIFICAQRVQEFQTLLGDTAKFSQELKRWGARIRAEIKSDREFNIFAKLGLFRQYINESNHVPNFWEEFESDCPPASHWSHSIEITLRGQLGWTAEEIDETPLSKALADYFQWAQAEGLIRIIPEEDARQMEADGAANMKALMASLAAAGMDPEGMDGIEGALRDGRIQASPERGRQKAEDLGGSPWD